MRISRWNPSYCKTRNMSIFGTYFRHFLRNETLYHVSRIAVLSFVSYCIMMYYEVNTKQAKQTWVWKRSTDIDKHFDGLAQDWGNSISNGLELLQSCSKPSIWSWAIVIYIAPSPHSNQVSSIHTGSALGGWMDPSQTRGVKFHTSLIAMFMGPTWGLPGADRTQVGPMLALWTLLSGMPTLIHQFTKPETEALLCLNHTNQNTFYIPFSYSQATIWELLD